MKNIDFINNIVSKKLNIDEETIKKVNKYYWNSGVRKKLSNLDSTAVFVKGLCTFTASRYNIRKLISKVIRQIRAARTSPRFKETTREVYVADLYRKLRPLVHARNELAKLYYHERIERIPEANTHSSEKLRESSGGNSEECGE